MKRTLYITLLFLVVKVSWVNGQLSDSSQKVCGCSEKTLLKKREATISAMKENSFKVFISSSDTFFICLRILNKKEYYKFLNEIAAHTDGVYMDYILQHIEKLIHVGSFPMLEFLAEDSGNLELTDMVKEIAYHHRDFLPEQYKSEKKSFLIDIDKLYLNETKKEKLRLLFP